MVPTDFINGQILCVELFEAIFTHKISKYASKRYYIHYYIRYL